VVKKVYSTPNAVSGSPPDSFIIFLRETT